MSNSVSRIKEKIGAYYELMRIFFPMILGTMSFSAAIVAAKGLPSPWLSFATFTAPFLGAAAGIAANDYFHRDVDKIENPHRPIPTGRISPTSAFIFAWLLAIGGIALTITLNPINYLLAVATFISTLAYHTARRSRVVGPVLRALTDVLGMLYGYVAVAGKITLIIVSLALIDFVDVVSSNVGSSDVRHIFGDSKEEVQTPAVRFGPKKAAKWGFIFLAMSILLGFLPHLLGYLNIIFLVTFLFTRIPVMWTYFKVVKTPVSLFTYFTQATHLFCRVSLVLSFIIGVLPTDQGIILAVTISALSIMAPVTYHNYVIKEGLKRKDVAVNHDV